MTLFRYSSGKIIQTGDRVGYDALDGHGLVATGRVSGVFAPGTAEAADYACEETGGVLLLFDNGDLQLWPEIDEHLVRLVDMGPEARCSSWACSSRSSSSRPRLPWKTGIVMPDQPAEPDADVLLFYFEEKFAACRDELEPMLAKTSAYLMRNPYFFRSRAEPGFLLVSIPDYDWNATLGPQERTALRQASEAAYLSRGYPPYHDDSLKSAD